MTTTTTEDEKTAAKAAKDADKAAADAAEAAKARAAAEAKEAEKLDKARVAAGWPDQGDIVIVGTAPLSSDPALVNSARDVPTLEEIQKRVPAMPGLHESDLAQAERALAGRVATLKVKPVCLINGVLFPEGGAPRNIIGVPMFLAEADARIYQGSVSIPVAFWHKRA